MALIRNPPLLEYLETHADEARTKSFFEHVVGESVRLKAEVVQLDERDTGLRAILNFGHTVGHAIESVLRIPHGFAVSIGMVVEAQLAKALGILEDHACSRIVRLLKTYNLPTDVPAEADIDALCASMGMDKKNLQGRIRVCMLERLGYCAPEPRSVGTELLHWAICQDVMIRPLKRPITGTIRVPGSKSLSNRALLLAALGRGPCALDNLLLADDTLVMIQALRDMGIPIELGSRCVVHGGSPLTVPAKSIYLGNAGTATRFLLAASLLVKEPIEFVGSHRMNIRPQKDLLDALQAMGCRVECLGKPGCLPLKMYPNGFPGGRVQISGAISSQYISALLLCAPWASTPLTIVVTNLVSRPFVDMTIELMRIFGHCVTEEPANTFHVKLFQHTNPESFFIEPDASSSTYSLAMAAATGGDVCVEGLHKTSLQGDAQFAWKVLEPMGCVVEDTPAGVRVRGPDKLKPLGEVDMSDVTDTFLTTVALGALADGRTACTNIANQRVKECNRLEAMTTNLRKLGLRVNELPDGIEVYGPVEKSDPVSILTFDDHRIAMSFAVLGAVVPNIRICDKSCVEKTFSDFWCDLHSLLKVDFEPISMKATKQKSSTTLFLLGMRGAGKTTLGQRVASLLDVPFIDCDDVLEKRIGAFGPFVATHGWPRFREEEMVVLESLREQGGIVACGGGVVEIEAARAFFKSEGVSTCFIHRNFDDLVTLLDPRRPAFTEPFDVVYRRRLPKFLEADRVLTIRAQDSDIHACAKDLKHLVAPLVDPAEHSVPRKQWDDALFLCLTLPNLEQSLPLAPEVLDGVDAVEIRVDLLAAQDIDALRTTLTAFTRHHGHIPVLWTLRSKEEGGQWQKNDNYREIIDVGIQGGARLIDLEMAIVPSLWPRIRDAAERGAVTVIMSHHNDDVDAEAKIEEARNVCHNCIPKTVTSGNSCAARALPYQYGHVTLCLGERGALSRVLNRTLTPVTHASLENSAPGQLSAADVISWRRSLQLEPRERRFFVFGHPVSLSSSPCLHNAAFIAAGKTHWSYAAYDTEDAGVVKQVLSRITSGGGSLTIPLKESIIPYLDHLTDSAKTIGAVNTVKVENGRLLGDNTDWQGIAHLVETSKRNTALVIGAGGTARAALYALRQLQFDSICIYNRTFSNGESLATEFGCKALKEIPSTPFDAVVSTIPGGSVIPTLDAHTVCVDAHYASGPGKERYSPFSQAARALPCSLVSEGLDLLFLQAVEQSRWWLGEDRRVEMARALRVSPACSSGIPRTVQNFCAEKRPHSG
eukprot:GEMP01001044.1.p1 GENE.GEMP01001044.1~~GEMP01001044.1.p1  ORF type:complete len:1477 (+),score=332.95 GEMP01001044.1:603-4433(+)